MRFVVDTNVPIAANGKNTHASNECQLNCVKFLSSLVDFRKNSKVILDDQDLIFNEYCAHFSFSGQPGVGDVFFKYLHDNKHLNRRVQIVKVTPNGDGTTGFDELPDNSLDKNDRKFLAVALVAKARVVNALDTDWHEQKILLEELDVKIQQLCPEQACVIAAS